MSDYRINRIQDKAQVFTPYNKEFVRRIKNAGGRWDGEEKCWTVPCEAIDVVRSIMLEVFGRTDEEPLEEVKVRLTIREAISERWDDVRLLGHTLSHATGRDSGASPGNDVFYEQGRPESGGSVKNWRSVVPEGSVIVLGKVSRAMLDAAELPECVLAEVVSATGTDIQALMDERDRLMARIEEIDRLLAREEG